MKNIYVGNLSFQATEESVRALFAPHGSVGKVNLITDRETGQARGFGFVEMAVDREGDRAIEALNGVQVDGRTLTVNEAKPRTGGGFGRR